MMLKQNWRIIEWKELIIFAKTKLMNMEKTSRRATEFVVFCIENTAAKLGIPAHQLFLELKRTDGIRSFLYPSYAALHTQSKELIVDETIEYIRQHNPSFVNQKK